MFESLKVVENTVCSSNSKEAVYLKCRKPKRVVLDEAAQIGQRQLTEDLVKSLLYLKKHPSVVRICDFIFKSSLLVGGGKEMKRAKDRRQNSLKSVAVFDVVDDGGLHWCLWWEGKDQMKEISWGKQGLQGQVEKSWGSLTFQYPV